MQGALERCGIRAGTLLANRLGRTLRQLENKIRELQEQFEIHDLNINLRPLGNLLDRQEKTRCRKSSTPRKASNLADVLERILDKGIVIAGDIRIKLCDVELLTIQIRLLMASLDRAREMGIDWWTRSPFLSSSAPPELPAPASTDGRLAAELEQLRQRVQQLEASPPHP
jgi:hypothetical protein